MFRRFRILMVPCVVGIVAATVVPAAAQTKLLRFPDIHGDRVVFSYAGDLWLASTDGGQATRLTAHPGLELFARFSPDGSRIAFTGQYDGDEQVYVIPATGGVPRQLTYYPARGPLAPRWGYDNQVYDWSPDGQAVLFRSLRYSTDLSDSRLYLASADGGLPIPLPMPESGAGDLSPDGSRVVYSPLFRDFRTWKRYEGGWAQELYIFDRETHVVERITTHRRADRDPMWIGNAIYFTSDRSGTLNLYRYDLASREMTQLTESDTWDVRWPGDDGVNRIVYELNGELAIYSIDEGTSRPITITVPDDGLAMRPSRVAAADLIEDAELSPQGERALFVARGDVFTAPIENGPTRNLTRSSSAHDKWARWSPDGRRIAYVSDASGEDEIYLVAQDGSGEPEQLTTGGQAMRYAPEWSPTGDHLAFGDKDGRLYVIDVETQSGGRRGRRSAWATARLRLVAPGRPPGVLDDRRDGVQLHLRLEPGGSRAASGHRRVLPRMEPRRGIRTATISITCPTGSSRRSSARSSGITWSIARPASTPWRCAATWSTRCRRRATRWS